MPSRVPSVGLIRPPVGALAALLATTLLATLLPGRAGAAPSPYKQPSPAIRELLDTPALPRLLPSPDRQSLALVEQRR